MIARAELGGKVISSGVRVIEYPHIPIQVVYPKARMRVARAEVQLLAKKIGYVMGGRRQRSRGACSTRRFGNAALARRVGFWESREVRRDCDRRPCVEHSP